MTEFERVSSGGRVRGYQLEADGILYFFGTRELNGPGELADLYPEYEFAYLTQVHGDRIVAAARGPVEEADAHFTDEAGLALVVRTADCLPVLFAGPTRVCAAHAGWRGLASGLLTKATACFGPGELASVVIGPHIHERSFAVGPDVEARLAAAWPARAPRAPDSGAPRGHFDLGALARAQIGDAGLAPEAIRALDRDTFSRPEFASFRRDGRAAGRQLSFVARV